MRCREIQIGGNSFKKNLCFLGKSLFFTKITQFRRKIYISAKKTHVFRKGTSFLRILRKRRTFPKGIICRFSQEFTKFQRKTHKFTKCSRKTHIFRKKMSHFCEFCEKDARFPRVEFVDFRKIGGWGAKGV